MGILLFEFYMEYRDIGSIESKVSVYEERVVIDRRIYGALTKKIRIPTTTVVYFDDIEDINLVYYKISSFLSSKTVGWIDFSGDAQGSSAKGIVEANPKAANKTEIIKALKNQYCVAYNTDSKNGKKNYMRLYTIFEEWKEKNTYTNCV